MNTTLTILKRITGFVLTMVFMVVLLLLVCISMGGYSIAYIPFLIFYNEKLSSKPIEKMLNRFIEWVLKIIDPLLK
jgi:succinate dehydrogenase/fumarate reductase cytochrome b subunit